MTREEHAARTRDILANLNDQAKISQILTELSEDNGAMLTAKETAETTAADLTQKNEQLRDANMKLFLKVSGPAPKDEHKTVDDSKRKNFDDLYDEKGRLK